MPPRHMARKTPRNRPPGKDAAKRDRAIKALELRIAGATYRQIGAQLGVSECTAYHDVQEELGRLDTIGKEKAERLRELEARRLDALTIALAPALQSGDVRAILAAVRVMERRAKLLGLDGPQQFAGPDGGPVAITVIHQQIE
jgi:DNA-binding CsgD family transcriptional regulator